MLLRKNFLFRQIARGPAICCFKTGFLQSMIKSCQNFHFLPAAGKRLALGVAKCHQGRLSVLGVLSAVGCCAQPAYYASSFTVLPAKTSHFRGMPAIPAPPDFTSTTAPAVKTTPA